MYRKYALAVLCVSAWGLDYPFSKVILRGYQPYAAVTLRLCLVFLFSVPFANVPPRDRWLSVLALSVLLFSGPLCIAHYALLYVDANIVAFVSQLDIPLAIILGILILKEPVRLNQWIGVMISLVGLYIIFESPEVGLSNAYYVALIAIGSLACAIASIIVRMSSLSAFSLVAWSVLLAIPQAATLSYFTEVRPWAFVQTASVISHLFLLLNAFLYTFSFGLWSQLLKDHKIATIIPFTSLMPLATIFSSYVLLGELTHRYALSGGLLIITGVAILGRSAPHPS